MSISFEETYAHNDDLPLPSERSTGLVFAAVALIVGAIWYTSPAVFWPAAVATTSFTILALAAPRLLGPLNRAWFKFGLVLNKIMSPVVMFILFAVVIVPAGLIMRCFADPLQLKRRPDTQTYWRTRDADTDAVSSMRNQF